MSKETYTTVVFKSQGSKAVKEMFDAFANNKGLFKDTLITAMSHRDEISAIEKIENECQCEQGESNRQASESRGSQQYQKDAQQAQQFDNNFDDVLPTF